MKFADERMAWASEVKDKGDKAIEAARQFEDLKAQVIAHGAIAAWANEVKDKGDKAFEDLKAQIIANAHGAIFERLAEVKAAAEKLSVANSAAQSAIAIAVGASAADRERRNDDPLKRRVG